MSNSSSGESFLQRIFGSLFNKKDPEAEKKKLLKQIAKSLSKTKWKFYKHSADQLLPAFPKLFYEIYKAVVGCQLSFNNQQNPNSYKMMVVDYALTEEQKRILEELTEESITTMSRNMDFNQLKKQIKTDIDKLSADFDKEKIQKIDTLYTKLMKFKQFCTFDFYFMLKKFDSTMREGDFSKTPKFNPIDASYVSEDLKDFLTVAWALPLDSDWSDMMQMFKVMKGVEPMKPNQWNKIVTRLNQIRSEQVIEMIIQLTTKDPTYSVVIEEKHEQIVESYIDKIRTQAQLTIRKLESEQMNSKIDSLLTQIFNTTSIFSLKYYTEQASEAFLKRGLPGFEYAKPLNYMRFFLIEFVKRDVRTYADLVLIRGKWTNPQLSQTMSDAFHAMMDLADKISAFDQKHNEEGGDFGAKLKTLLPRIDRDKEAKGIIKTTIKDSNSMAKTYLVNTTKAMIVFAKSTKALIEDYKKPRGELVSNWKEIDRFAETPLNELAVDIYKKIYLFVNLMQNFLQK